jgi:hypothetical protein
MHMENSPENPRREAIKLISDEELKIWEEMTRDDGENSVFAANIPFDRAEIVAEITKRREEKEDTTSSETLAA